MVQFEEVYRRSLDAREEFWSEAAAAIDWVEPWGKVSTILGRRSIGGLPAVA